MKHRLLRILSITSLIAILLFTTAGIALAVDYYLYVKASSESGTSDYAPLAFVPDVNNQKLADLGYISESGLDTRVTYLGSELKHMVAEDKLAFVAPEVKGGTNYSYRYTMGNEALDSFSIIPGYDGYVTVSDDASLELGSDFQIEMDGWIDTTSGSGKYLLYKPDSFVAYISATGEITSGIIDNSTTATETLRPNAAGDEESIPNLVDSTHWGATSDQSDATYVWKSGSGDPTRDLYNLPSYTGGSLIAKVTGWVRAKEGTEGSGGAFASIKTHDTVYDQSVGISESIEDRSYEWTTNPYTGESWSVAEVDALQAGVQLNNSTNGSAYCYEVWIVVTYITGFDSVSPSVTATGVSSGEHTVKTTADGTFLSIGIDGTDTIVTDGLVLNAPLWRTELDGSPFTTWDVNEHSCTVTGAVWSPDGRTFDGDDKIAIDAASTLQSLTTGSIEVWGKIASLEASKGFFSAGDVDDATSYIGLYFSTAGGGVMYAICYNDGEELYNDLFPGAIPTAGKWHHYVLVQDGVEPVLYMDATEYAIGGARPDDTGWFADVLDIDTVLLGQMVNQAWGNLNGVIGEVRVYNHALTPSEIQQNYNATKWKYEGGATNSDYYFLGGASVPDNSNDWTIMEGNSASYLDYYKHYVGGTLIAWHQPNDMISGTTLPDREGTAQDATITWGSLPDGISTTIGALNIINLQNISKEVEEGAYLELFGEAPPEWEGLYEGEQYNVLPGSEVISELATAGQIPLKLFWVPVIFGIAIFAGLFIYSKTKNIMAVAIAGGIVIGLFCGIGMLVWWVIIPYAIVSVAMCISEKTYGF